jgi:hypothetical protein
MNNKIKIDYCSCFPEKISGIFIGNCCQNHDNAVGEKGTYNPIAPHIEFNKCLKNKKVPTLWRYLIVSGGALLSWIKYPHLAYKIYKYRKGLK